MPFVSIPVQSERIHADATVSVHNSRFPDSSFSKSINRLEEPIVRPGTELLDAHRDDHATSVVPVNSRLHNANGLAKSPRIGATPP